MTAPSEAHAFEISISARHVRDEIVLAAEQPEVCHAVR